MYLNKLQVSNICGHKIMWNKIIVDSLQWMVYMLQAIKTHVYGPEIYVTNVSWCPIIGILI